MFGSRDSNDYTEKLSQPIEILLQFSAIMTKHMLRESLTIQPQTTRTCANLSQFLAGAAAAVRVAFVLTADSFTLVILSSPACMRNSFITGHALPAQAAAPLDSEEVGGRSERPRSSVADKAAVRESSSTFLAVADRGDVRVGGADARAELTEPTSTSTSTSSRDVSVSTTLTSTSGVAVPASRRSGNTLLCSSTLKCSDFNKATDISDTDTAEAMACYCYGCQNSQEIKFLKNHRVEFNRDIQLGGGGYVVRNNNICFNNFRKLWNVAWKLSCSIWLELI